FFGVQSMPRASKQQARYAVGRCLMLWSSNDVTQQGSRPKTKLGLFVQSFKNWLRSGKAKNNVFAEVFHGIGFFSTRRAFFWLCLKKHSRPNARQNILGFVQGRGLKTSVLAQV
ncbi:hypothetical protein VCX45_23055, partial [Aeromonas caviae]|uniref:hypothetical protein n=1 Tax=Aeromonas caviae TaxID=648 RepID=UPI002B25242B